MEEFIILYFSVTWLCILLNLSIFISSAFIHELGHFTFGSLEGCVGKIIALDYEYKTYTELECMQPPSIFVSMGGLLFNLVFSFLFLFLKLPEKNFHIVVIGLSFLLSSYDFGTISPNLTFVSILSGIVLIVFGEIKFLNERFMEIETSSI
jgi:hypothetical protein